MKIQVAGARVVDDSPSYYPSSSSLACHSFYGKGEILPAGSASLKAKEEQ